MMVKRPFYSRNSRSDMLRICTLIIIIKLNPIQSYEADNFIITSISNASSIYYEPLDNITFTSGSWHLLSYINILSFLNFGYEILDTFKELTVHCQNNCILNEITAQIIIKERKIKSVLNEISLILENTVDITLKDDFQNFKTALIKMQKSDNSTFDWYEKQIYIFPSILTDTCKKIIHAQNTIARFKNWHLKFPNSTDSLYEMFEVSWITNIKDATHHYILSIQQLSTNLAFAINGNWHPTLLSLIPFNSIKNLASISSPYQTANDLTLSELLIFAKVQLFFYEKKLVISLSLPFISEKKYQIFKPYSIPIYHTFNSDLTTSIFIKSKISYLALSNDKQTYFTFDDYLYDTCHSTQIGKICTFTPPEWSTLNNQICETALLTENKLYQCQFYLKITNNIQWTPLKFYQGWLYSTPFPTKIRIHCPQKISTQITVNNAGILQTQSDCIIEANNLVLPQINTKSKSLLKITPTTGHSTSLHKIAPNLYNLSLNSNPLLKNLFSSWNNNEIISLSTLEQQLFTFLQFQKSYNKRTEISKDFETLSFYIFIVTIVFIIISLLFMLFGLCLYIKIHKNAINLKTLEPPVTHQDLNLLENEPIQLEQLKTSHSQPKFLNTLV